MSKMNFNDSNKEKLKECAAKLRIVIDRFEQSLLDGDVMLAAIHAGDLSLRAAKVSGTLASLADAITPNFQKTFDEKMTVWNAETIPAKENVR